MRRLAFATATVLLAASAVAGVAAPASAAPADSLYALVNDARAAGGLPALARNTSIEAVALNWANTMAANGTLAHNADVAGQLPSGWSAVAENIATGQPSATAMHADWMASAGHRANILGDYTDIGIAFITVKGTTWGVQNFARYAAPSAPSAPRPSPSPAARQPVPAAPPSAAPRSSPPTSPKPQPSEPKATPKATPSPSASATPTAASGAAEDLSTGPPEASTRSTPAADVDHNPIPGVTLFGLALTAATAFIIRATRRARWGKHRGR